MAVPACWRIWVREVGGFHREVRILDARAEGAEVFGVDCQAVDRAFKPRSEHELGPLQITASDESTIEERVAESTVDMA